MTKATKRQTRKRRSFWEPESAALIEWLDEQSDLGKSLQVLIVDAIERYGSGDAVSAYLNQRLEQADVAPAPRPKKAAKTAPASPPEMPDIPEPTPAPEPPAEDDSEAVSVEPEPVAPKSAPEPDTAPSSELADDYDPLEEMFKDVGSNMK